jgi:predicted transcriptional regulator
LGQATGAYTQSSRDPGAYVRRQAALREAVEQVPDDASVEDVMERLYFLAKVARGIEAADRGDVIAHEDVEREFPAPE